MSRVISIRVPQRLYSDLNEHARSRGLRPAEAARDLLRRALQMKSARDSGFEEGKIAGHAEYMRRLNGVND